MEFFESERYRKRPQYLPLHRSLPARFPWFLSPQTSKKPAIALKICRLAMPSRTGLNKVENRGRWKFPFKALWCYNLC